MTDWDLLSSYAGLLTLAVGSVYVGAYGSLPNPKQNKRSNEESDSESDDEDEVVERLSSEDAWIFPLMGSAVLLGLYTVIKYFGKEWINWFLGYFFAISGVVSVWKSLVVFARFTLGSERWKKFDRFVISVRRAHKYLVYMSWRTPTLYLLPLGAVPSFLYTFSAANRKSALLTNILSLSYSYQALSVMRIDSFKTGSILLSGLFVYDIWWVFGTEVMLNVATTLDIPIKLLWPKSMMFSGTRGFTMLGLGDVVIPGTFIALGLRFDYHRYCNGGKDARFTKPYFYTTLVAYVAGLATTIAVMHIFASAQPALLYLSPACILSFFVTAVVRGELKAAWDWSDGQEETPALEKGTPELGGELDGGAVANGESNLELSDASAVVVVAAAAAAAEKDGDS